MPLCSARAVLITRSAGGGGGGQFDTDWVIAGAGDNITDTGNDAWLNPGNITADDGVDSTAGALSGGQTTRLLRATAFNFSALDNAWTITGIAARYQKSRQTSGATGVVDSTVRLTLDGTNMVGDNKADTTTNWPNPIANVDYGGQNILWGIAPTVAQVKATTFGVFMKATVTGATSTNVRVDAVWLRLWGTS